MDPSPQVPTLLSCAAEYTCKVTTSVEPNFPQNHIATMQTLQVLFICIAAIVIVGILAFLILDFIRSRAR